MSNANILVLNLKSGLWQDDVDWFKIDLDHLFTFCLKPLYTSSIQISQFLWMKYPCEFLWMKYPCEICEGNILVANQTFITYHHDQVALIVQIPLTFTSPPSLFAISHLPREQCLINRDRHRHTTSKGMDSYRLAIGRMEVRPDWWNET